MVGSKKLTPPKKIRAGARKTKIPPKHKNTPNKHKNTPKRRKKYQLFFFFRANARKKTALFQKIIHFAVRPRRPATPGIPALVRCCHWVAFAVAFVCCSVRFCLLLELAPSPEQKNTAVGLFRVRGCVLASTQNQDRGTPRQ